VHYHVIPAPRLDAPNAKPKAGAEVVPAEAGDAALRRMHKFEFESRETLDEEEAEELVTRVRAHL